MLTSIFLLIFQGISGGVSGYITNKYAVDMLFKEYTPLKLGGVIKKKREKFIEEMSELVERDVINSQTLSSQISNKNFNIYFEHIAKTVFEKGLKDSVGTTKFSEIYDFKNTIVKSEEFAKKQLEIVIPQIVDDISVAINLQDIITEEEASKIAKVSYELLTTEFEKESSFDEFIYNIYKENSNLTLSNVFSEQVQTKLNENITNEIMFILEENIFNDEEKLKLLLDKLLLTANINSTLIKLQGLIGDYELNQFFNKTDKDEFTLNLFNKINEFINSENGKEIVVNLVNDIFLICKDMEFTLYEILPAEMEDSLTEFIRVIIPKVMPYISEWISSNKDNLDMMIEEAIDEAIDGVDESIKKLIISKVRSALMGDISAKNNIVNKVIDYLNNNLNEEAYNKISDYIITYLKNTKIKDILTTLENKNFINSEKLVEITIKEFGLHGSKIIEAIIKSQFSKKIYKLFNLDLVKLFNEKLKPMLYKNIIDNKKEIKEKLNITITNFITLKSQELFNMKLDSLISDNKVQDFSKNFRRIAGEFLKKNKSIGEDAISSYIISEVTNIDFKSVIQNYKVDISKFIVDKSLEGYRSTVDKYKEYELKEFIAINFNEKQLADILINKGYPLLMDKLPSLVDGKIKGFVKNNLNKYNEDEICDIVQEFMGNQLKPLSVFGAFLGVIVGVGWQLIYPISSLGNFGFPSTLIDGIISCGLMAFIGIITNVVALWMIFHPYKENKLVAKIPFIKNFAMGYIPAHKNEFALGMAKLIDEQLLNKDEINKSFNLHKHTIQASLVSLVKNNNYQMLINFARDKKTDAANYIYGKILKHCDGNSNLSKKLSKLLGSIEVGKVLKEEHLFGISAKLITSVTKLKDALVNIAQDKISSNNKLEDILPKSTTNEINIYMESEISKVVEERFKTADSLSFVKQFVYEQYKDSYDLTIKKSFEEIFDKDLVNNIKENLSEKACNYVLNDFRIQINNSLKQVLSKGLDENNNIGSMFNGKIKTFVDANLYSLTNIATKKLLVYLQEHEYEITIEVQETIKGELNFFENIAYASFGGDEIAGRAVEIILKEKLPIMLRNETERLVEVAKTTLDSSIYTIKISNLKIKAREFNTPMLIDNIFEQLNRNLKSKEYINDAVNLVLNSLASTPIIEYLELCRLNSLELVYSKFGNELTIIEEDIYNSIKNNSLKLAKTIGEFIRTELVKPFFESDNSKIFKDISYLEIENSVSNILNLLSKCNETKKCLDMFIKNSYNNVVSKLPIEKAIDIDELSDDINKFINNLIGNNEFNEKNISRIETIINNAAHNKFEFISDEAKDYLINKGVEIGIYSVSEHIVPILKEVDLREITMTQMELLNPREIDLLFNSFAGDLFYKLKIYGVFGFVFGINVWLSIILWFLDWRYSSTSKKDLNELRE